MRKHRQSGIENLPRRDSNQGTGGGRQVKTYPNLKALIIFVCLFMSLINYLKTTVQCRSLPSSDPIAELSLSFTIVVSKYLPGAQTNIFLDTSMSKNVCFILRFLFLSVSFIAFSIRYSFIRTHLPDSWKGKGFGNGRKKRVRKGIWIENQNRLCTIYSYFLILIHEDVFYNHRRGLCFRTRQPNKHFLRSERNVIDRLKR